MDYRIFLLIFYGAMAAEFWLVSGSLSNVFDGLFIGSLAGLVISLIWRRMKSNRLSYLKGYILIAVTLLLLALLVVYWLVTLKK